MFPFSKVQNVGLVKYLPKIIIKTVNPIIQLKTKLKVAIFSPKIQQSKTLVLMERCMIRDFLIHYKFPKNEARIDQLPTSNFTLFWIGVNPAAWKYTVCVGVVALVESFFRPHKKSRPPKGIYMLLSSKTYSL